MRICFASDQLQSTNRSSFSVVSACTGVFERTRRTHCHREAYQSSAASDTAPSGIGKCRVPGDSVRLQFPSSMFSVRNSPAAGTGIPEPVDKQAARRLFHLTARWPPAQCLGPLHRGPENEALEPAADCPDHAAAIHRACATTADRWKTSLRSQAVYFYKLEARASGRRSTGNPLACAFFRSWAF